MNFQKLASLIILTLIFSFNSHALTNIENIKVGALEEAVELAPIFSSMQMGSNFTINNIPAPRDDLFHPIREINSGINCAFQFKTKNISLNRGDLYQVTRMKRVVSNTSLRAIIELVRAGTDGKNPQDKIFYKCEFDITSKKQYDESKFLDGLLIYFHSVAQSKRINAPYAGQFHLELQH